jgi:protein SCO1/2
MNTSRANPCHARARLHTPLSIVCGAIVLLAIAPWASAASQAPAPSTIVAQVGIDQKLGSSVPLDLQFRDESGAPVRLGQYFGGKKPVLLSLVYYRCPGLCTMTLNGMAAAFKPLKFTAGKEFDVVTVSIDPKETPQLASEKKAQYLKRYGRAGAENGWHFLTGSEDVIRALAAAVGFRYVYHPQTDQYTHAAGIMLLTPQGKIARYYYGLEYSSRDLRLGMVEASEERIGTLADAVSLLCYQYDPMTGKYGVAIMRAIRTAGVLTVVGLGTFILLMVRRERRAPLSLTLSPEHGRGGTENRDVRTS